MRVVCIFPIAYNSNNISDIQKKFQKEVLPKLILLGASSGELKFASGDYVFVATNQELIGEPKGKGILQTLKNVSEEPDIVICCDGSGAIPYSYIPQIFRELVSDHSICCVMANRTENKAIAVLRYAIERFEVFSLKKYHEHNGEILDGQCGLWGYRYGDIYVNATVCQILLTAEGYEIELDLLGEILEKDLNYSFIDVELPKRDANSSFTYKNNLDKMKFLVKKYSKFGQLISQYFLEFESSQEYKELIIKKEDEDEWKKYKTDLVKLISEL